ncbi:MAG: hypothetical protein R3D46_10165 [Defluviimonas denitrificans]
MAQLSVRISETLTRRMLWTNSLAADQAGPSLTSPNEIVEFANHAVDAIFLAVLHAQEGRISRGLDPPRSMIGVLHRLFSMAREGRDLCVPTSRCAGDDTWLGTGECLLCDVDRQQSRRGGDL